MNVKISLTEFEDGKTFNIDQFKNWFPKGKFHKRFPYEYIKKWLRVNGKYLDFLGISYKWDEESKSLVLIPSNKVGLAPLKNPYGGQVYGSIIVKPRLGWLKIYEIIALCGVDFESNSVLNLLDHLWGSLNRCISDFVIAIFGTSDIPKVIHAKYKK